MGKFPGRYFYRAYGVSDAEYKQNRKAGLAYCPSHGWTNDLEANGRTCTRCARTRHAEWKKANPEKLRAILDRSREKDRIRAYNHYHSLTPMQKQAEARKGKLRQYGVTPAWYDEQLEKQNRVCAICGKHIPSGKYKKYMHVDHNHETGKARGILCNGCNTGIAWLEKIEWRAKAEAYLNVYRSMSS